MPVDPRANFPNRADLSTAGSYLMAMFALLQTEENADMLTSLFDLRYIGVQLQWFGHKTSKRVWKCITIARCLSNRL
jgi:hypothetical protein